MSSKPYKEIENYLVIRELHAHSRVVNIFWEWKQWLLIERNLAENTVIAYTRDVKHFFLYLTARDYLRVEDRLNENITEKILAGTTLKEAKDTGGKNKNGGGNKKRQRRKTIK